MNDFEAKLDELDRLLNDPDVALQPDHVWSLLAEVSQREAARDETARRGRAGPSPV